MALELTVNGMEQTLGELSSETPLARVVEHLGLKADRVAIERNGEIVRRGSWESALVSSGDKLEIVHFVGGGHSPAQTIHNIRYRT